MNVTQDTWRLLGCCLAIATAATGLWVLSTDNTSGGKPITTVDTGTGVGSK